MMVRWATKSLFHRPGSLVGSVTALAAALVLVILFEGIWRGESGKNAEYPRKTDADVWVMQRGVSNMHMATSFIAESKRDKVAAVEGVADAAPILYMSMLVRIGSWRSFAYVVGLSKGIRRGGPWSMAVGKDSPGPGEAIIPDLLSRMEKVGIGDSIHIADMSLKVVGLSRETYSMVNPILFVFVSDLSGQLSLKGYDSYLAVKAEPGVDPAALARRIKHVVEGVAAITREEFIRNDEEMSMQMGTELIGLIASIGETLAALILGFVLYTNTWQRRRDLAVLKAIGFGNRQLYAGTLVQALALGAMGFGLAVVLSYAGMAAISILVPQVTVQLSIPLMAKVGAGVAGVAMLATLIPARQVTRVDPHSVFQ